MKGGGSSNAGRADVDVALIKMPTHFSPNFQSCHPYPPLLAINQFGGHISMTTIIHQTPFTLSIISLHLFPVFGHI